MQPGKYNTSFTWLRRSTTKAEDGQEVESFANNGVLWGQLSPTTGSTASAYGADQTQVSGTIRIPQWPALSALDRLQDRQFDDVWLINGLYRDGFELVCDVMKFDDLTLEDQ